jgi:hypothetical protein
MGLEADCRVRWGDREVVTRAHLDTDRLDLRGMKSVPFASMKNVEARRGELVFTVGGERVSLALGADAAKWHQRIRYPKGRLDKLGIKPGARVTLLGVDDEGFVAELVERLGADAVSDGKSKQKDQDAVFLAVGSPRDLDRLGPVQARIKRDGAVWVVRPKGKGVVVTERQVMDAAKGAGLVDVKVVSFSDTHTAEKLVIPVAKR